MLALGRALGETMAVTFIIGNSFKIQSSIFAPGTTISAAIASEFAESDGLHQSGLILLGLLLFVLTFFVLAAALFPFAFVTETAMLFTSKHLQTVHHYSPGDVALLNTGVHPVRAGEAEGRQRLLRLAQEFGPGMRARGADGAAMGRRS